MGTPSSCKSRLVSLNRQGSSDGMDGGLSFAELLTNLLTRFINLPADQMDLVIEDAQRQICEFYGFDRSTFWQVSQGDPDIILLTHYHESGGKLVVTKQSAQGVLPYGAWINQASDDPEYYMRTDCKMFFPWVVSKLKKGEPVSFSRIDDLPEEAALDKKFFRQFSTKSSLVLPLFVGGKWQGIMSFASVQDERVWPRELVSELSSVAQIFANALDRKRSDLFLRERERGLALAAESADASLWKLILNTGQIWVTDNSWDLYGIPRDEPLTLQRFLDFVHVDDRERITSAIREVKESGGQLKVEYRLLSADGTVHWVVSRGRLQADEIGDPYCLTGATVDITELKLLEEQLQRHIRNVEELKRRVENENLYLQGEIKNLAAHGTIISHSTAMHNVISLARQVAGTDSSVLILGETGTGKELLARAIHDLSARRNRPLITVNCASLPLTLFESELFGRERGAYTGAVSRMAGRFELADGSTIFLDEIGELPLELQAKLLRVIENGTFERLGSSTPIKVNTRIIVATNRNLFEDVKSGRFRSDLYYRLNVFPITIPPLRERPEDIPALVSSLVSEFQEKMGKKFDQISKVAMNALTAYSWPGNVRELRNVIERAMITSRGSTLEVQLPELKTGQQATQGKALRDMEREYIVAVLKETNWQIGGKGGAAELLDVNRTTLQAKMKKLGISHPA